MLHPTDDIFAFGQEPRASTVCSIALIDDLIIVGIIAAASIAASQTSAAEQESSGNRLLERQKANALRQKQFDYNAQESALATQRLASNPYGGGREDPASAVQPWVDKLQIQNGYDMGRRQVADQADMTRMNGYIQAGSTLAQGIAGQALRPAAGSNFTAGAAYDGTGMGIADRAGQYDLNPNTSQLLANGPAVATQTIRAADPSGGYQLQPEDYSLLGGQNPNRYRFTL